MSEADKALGPGAKDKYDTPEEQASADLLNPEGADKAQDQAPTASTPATPPPASATANSGTTSANAGPTQQTGA